MASEQSQGDHARDSVSIAQEPPREDTYFEGGEDINPEVVEINNRDTRVENWKNKHNSMCNQDLETAKWESRMASNSTTTLDSSKSILFEGSDKHEDLSLAAVGEELEVLSSLQKFSITKRRGRPRKNQRFHFLDFGLKGKSRNRRTRKAKNNKKHN